MIGITLLPRDADEVLRIAFWSSVMVIITVILAWRFA